MCLAMDTSRDNPRARQFSLRKLMLWMVVVGAYLGILQVTGIGLDFAIPLTVWMALILTGRLTWGKRGVLVAVVTATIFSVFSPWTTLGLLPSVLMWLCATVLGVVLFLTVHFVVWFIDWLDTLGQEK